ncbi:MAG: TonB-dependent receptor domain-containing protein [Candidatus Tyrphobacter sp.]
MTQSAAHTANITGTVRSSSGAPVAGAEVKLTGPSVRATDTNADGTFAFRGVPWGVYEITVTSALGTPSSASISLNEDIKVAIDYQAPANLRTIAHVSTSSAGAHINVTPSSVQSVSPSQYAFEGNATWTQLFAQIPGVAVSGLTEGGYNSSTAIAGSPQAPVVLSLNGALPYETATLLDGMPLQGTSAGVPSSVSAVGAGANLSTLPLVAFDSADIVRGPGANAPSIVDSIGGSFVLHAPGPVTADHFELSASNDPYGGLISNFGTGLRFGNLSVSLFYGVDNSPGPLGTSKVISAYSVTPTTIAGQPVWGSLTSYPPNGTGYGIPNCFCTETDSMVFCCVPQSTAWSSHSGAVAISYQVARSIRAEVFYAGNASMQNSQSGYSNVTFDPSGAAPPYNGSIAASPGGQPTYRFLDISGMPAWNRQSGSLLEEKVTAYIGAGVLQLAALQNRTFTNFGQFSSLPNGEYQLWGTASVGAAFPGTPTAYNGTMEGLTFPSETLTERFSSGNRDLMGSYSTQVGSTSSAGVSYTKSSYDNPFDQQILFGTTPIYTSVQTADASETTNETRVHFDVEPSDRLALSLSWYFTQANYHVPSVQANSWDNIGFRYNAPRLGIVWQPDSNIAVRAAVGGGYALPPLFYLNDSYLTCFATCFESVANQNLKPEGSFGLDVGADARLSADTVFSLDFYRTNMYGLFYQESSESTYHGLPLQITEYGNIAASRMDGINLVVNHAPNVGYYWRATLGLTRGYVTSVPADFYDNPGTCVRCVNQSIVPGQNFNSAAGFLATVPYASASGELGYRWSHGGYADLSSTYYGNNNVYYAPRAFFETNARAGYDLTKNLSLLLTVFNITNVDGQSVETWYPSYAVPVISGAPPYYPGAAFEVPIGPRSVLLTVGVHF